MPLGFMIVASSFALVTYARRTQGMLKRIEGNMEKRAPKMKEGPKSKVEHDKTRKRMEDDEF
eukprot:CAMPEP_0118648536 /NCGR_PEP_ID=MMETSP0785-20121206/9208_1 /TAXON_ID=91992 /ORGANISM="Bolidomonas pacifica, Strain CCMP 1866" /LENGTH=61 /DNA_ID=CAMNT_0006540735 /DNA_START=321 /DNA_END=506 /DNA_ORIENTATION=-